MLLLFLGNNLFAQDRNPDGVIISPSMITRQVLPPKPFKAFTPIEIANLELPLKKNADGTFSPMSQSECLNILNQAEALLTKEGYSLRDSIKNVSFGALKTNITKSEGFKALELMPAITFPTNSILETWAKISPPAVMTYSSSGAATDLKCDDEPINIHEAKSVSYTYTPEDIGYGDKGVVFAGISVSYETKGRSESLFPLCYKTATPESITTAIKKTNSEFSAFIGTETNMYVLNNRFKLAATSINLKAPSIASEKLSTNVVIMCIGKSIRVESEEYVGDIKEINKNYSDNVYLKLLEITLPIVGPISIRTTLSTGGSVGTTNNSILRRSGLTATVKPSGEFHVNLEGAIGIGGVAQVGVGGQLSVLNDNIAAFIQNGLSANATGWKLENYNRVVLDADFVRGRLYAFAQLGLCPGWFCLRGELTFADMKGGHTTRELINVNKTISFTNWQKNLLLKSNNAKPILNVRLNNMENSSERILVVPNPAIGKFNLIIENFTIGNATIRITDASGRIVKMQEVQIRNRKQLVAMNVENLSNGGYFVQVIQPDHLQVSFFRKQ